MLGMLTGRQFRTTALPSLSATIRKVWFGILEDGVLVPGSIRRLTTTGGDQFAFSGDGQSLIYSVGNHVWYHNLKENTRSEIPIELELRSAAREALLIENVRLLDLATGSFTPPTSAYLENGYIRSIGVTSAFELPDDLRRLDAQGRFAVPGLFDMHSHIQRSFSNIWLAYGITSIRDVGAPLGWVAALADRSDAQVTALPRIFFSGDILHGVSSTRDPIMISTADEARRYVKQWKNRSVHFIKTHPGLTWDTQLAIIDEAHSLGLQVVEHATPLAYLHRSVTAGADFVEHNSPFRQRLQLPQSKNPTIGWTTS